MYDKNNKFMVYVDRFWTLVKNMDIDKHTLA